MVRYFATLIAAVVGLSASTFAQKPAWPPSSDHPTLEIWPPGASANPVPETDTTTPKDNLIAGKPIIRLGNVSTPTLTLYHPTGKTRE
jgi:hypothetical protein